MPLAGVVHLAFERDPAGLDLGVYLALRNMDVGCQDVRDDAGYILLIPLPGWVHYPLIGNRLDTVCPLGRPLHESLGLGAIQANQQRVRVAPDRHVVRDAADAAEPR